MRQSSLESAVEPIPLRRTTCGRQYVVETAMGIGQGLAIYLSIVGEFTTAKARESRDSLID